MKELVQKGKQLPLFEFDQKNTITHAAKELEAEEARFSTYIVYVDESGDHSLNTVDENYPVFVLAFCIFHKRH
jgi:hypothetical protein